MQPEKETLIQKTINQEKSKHKLYLMIGGVLFVFVLVLGGFLFFSSSNNEMATSDTTSQFPDINTGSSTLETYTPTSTQVSGDDLDYLQNGSSTPTLTHIWPKAISGYTLSYTKTEIVDQNSTTTNNNLNTQNDTIVIKKYNEKTDAYFVDKGTGNIYSATSPLFTPIRLSIDTLPNTIDATFSSSTNFVFVRGKSSTGQIISSIYKTPRIENSLLNKVSDVDGRVLYVSNYGDNSFIYSKQDVSGSSIYLYDMRNNVENKIIGLPIKNYTLKYTIGGNILLQTKPLYLSNQETFIINMKTKNINLLSKTNIYNIYSKDLKQSIYLQNTKTSYTSDFGTYSLSKTTLPEKCVFYKLGSILCAVPSNSYGVLLPDDWYKGKAHFTDSFYIIHVNNKTESEVYNLSSSKVENIDLQHPLIDSGEHYTGFLNKNDKSLWIIDNTRLESYE